MELEKKVNEYKWDELTLETQELLLAAEEAREKAYAPHSNFLVGAAVKTANGTIYTGVNIENAAHPSAMCGERVAIFKAVSEGHTNFTGLAVSVRGEFGPAQKASTSCGGCRQVQVEFADLHGHDYPLWFTNSDKSVILGTTVYGILPDHFGLADLEVDTQPYFDRIHKQNQKL